MEGQGGGDEVVGDPISVFTTSWRVGDVIPDDIEEWIPDPDVETFDLYAFALHDLSYTSLTSPPVSRAHRTSVDGAVVRDHHLTKLIRQRLGDAYRTVQEVNVDATLRLVVFAHYAHTARAAIRPDVRVATASGRSMEGTAAAAISMHFYDTYLGFVALTFPPAPDAVSSAVLSGVSSLPLKEAYADSKWSLAKVAGRGKRRGKKEGEEGGAGVAAKHVAAVAVEAEYMLNGLRQQLGSVLDVVNDPDICLMMGSFNLPLLTSPSLAMDMALSRDWGQLLDLDCFRHAWSEGLLLNGLSDPLVMYAPTYKAARASHLELMDDAAPSFADRVLWKARPGLNVDPESVAAVLNVDTSDYKPVRSFLNITTRRKLNAAERTYKVQPNDTLHTISERFRVDPRMLGRTNGVRNNIELVIGRALRIPPAKVRALSPSTPHPPCPCGSVLTLPALGPPPPAGPLCALPRRPRLRPLLLPPQQRGPERQGGPACAVHRRVDRLAAAAGDGAHPRLAQPCVAGPRGAGPACQGGAGVYGPAVPGQQLPCLPRR